MKRRKFLHKKTSKRKQPGNTTVVILIKATTLTHKSNLSSNNFGNNHFGQKYQKQNILKIFRRLYGCLFEKYPTIRAENKKCSFVQTLLFLRIS